MPVDLLLAVTHAHRILDWQENLAADEMPPQWMWHLEDELEDHFEEVEARREEKWGTGTGGAGGRGDDGGEWAQNELTRGMRRR